MFLNEIYRFPLSYHHSLLAVGVRVGEIARECNVISRFTETSRIGLSRSRYFTLLYSTSMAVYVQNVFIGLAIFALLELSCSSTPHKRFEYKLSFKGPHLVQRDGTIPFWEHGGRKLDVKYWQQLGSICCCYEPVRRGSYFLVCVSVSHCVVNLNS